MLLSEDLGRALQERAERRIEREPVRAIVRLASLGDVIRRSLDELEDTVKANALATAKAVPAAIEKSVAEFFRANPEEDRAREMSGAVRLDAKPNRHGIRQYMTAAEHALTGAYGHNLPTAAQAAQRALDAADDALLRLPTGKPR